MFSSPGSLAHERRIHELEKTNRELKQQNKDQIQKIEKIEHSAKDWEQASTGHQKRIQELEKIVKDFQSTITWSDKTNKDLLQGKNIKLPKLPTAR